MTVDSACPLCGVDIERDLNRALVILEAADYAPGCESCRERLLAAQVVELRKLPKDVLSRVVDGRPGLHIIALGAGLIEG